MNTDTHIVVKPDSNIIRFPSRRPSGYRNCRHCGVRFLPSPVKHMSGAVSAGRASGKPCNAISHRYGGMSDCPVPLVLPDPGGAGTGVTHGPTTF
jgi:hypothetical protein